MILICHLKNVSNTSYNRGCLSSITIIKISTFNWYCIHDCSSSLHQYASGWGLPLRQVQQIFITARQKIYVENHRNSTEISKASLILYFLNLTGNGRATLQSFVVRKKVYGRGSGSSFISDKTSHLKIPQVSKPWDLYLKLPDPSEIWQGKMVENSSLSSTPI